MQQKYWYYWHNIERQRWLSAKTRREFVERYYINLWEPRPAMTGQADFDNLYEIVALLDSMTKSKDAKPSSDSVQYSVPRRVPVPLTPEPPSPEAEMISEARLMYMEIQDIEDYVDRCGSATPLGPRNSTPPMERVLTVTASPRMLTPPPSVPSPLQRDMSPEIVYEGAIKINEAAEANKCDNRDVNEVPERKRKVRNPLFMLKKQLSKLAKKFKSG